MKKVTILNIFIALLLCKTSFATVLIVNNNSNAPIGHYPTLQAAVTAGSSGDTIYVVGSPTNYGSLDIWVTSKSFVFIGAGYRPQKDLNYSSKIDGINAANIFATNGNNSKIFGFEIFGTIGKDGVSCCGGNNWEIAYNKFTGNSAKIVVGDNCNIHDNYFETPVSGTYGIITFYGNNCSVHNNIFSRSTGNSTVLITDGQAPPFNHTGNLIYNNHFLSTSGGNVFGYIYTSTIENNVFYGYSIADTNNLAQPQNCTINANLTNYPFAIFGNNVTSFPNYFGPFTLSQFQNANTVLNGSFDFPPYDYSLKSTSIGYNGGTAGIQIGAFGGTNPFSNFSGAHSSLPQIIKLDLANSIIGSNDPLTLHSTGFANSGDSIVSAEYFIDVDSNGTTFPLAVTGTTFDVTIPLTHGVAASASEHVFGVRVKSSNGKWSHPEMRSFRVCAVSGALPHFDAYVSGYDLILQNNSTDQQTCIWTFGDNNFSIDTSKYLAHHYDSAGVYDICLDANNPCTFPPLSNNHLCKTLSVKGINSISPVSGGNIGVVTMTITGAGFSDSTMVKLVKQGEPDIIPYAGSTIITNGINIQTVFNLKGVAVGLWDVVVQVPNDTTYNVLNYFKVETGRTPDPYVQFIGNGSLRRNTWQDYTVKVGNNGNTSAMLVPVWFAVPDYVDVDLKFNLINPPDTNIVNWDSVSVYFYDDTVFHQIGNFKVYGFIISSIVNGSSISLPIRLKSGSTMPFNVVVWNSRPWLYADSLEIHRVLNTSNCLIDNPKMDCLTCIGGAGLPGCAGAVISTFAPMIINQYCYGDPGITIMSSVRGAASISIQCGLTFFPGSALLQILEILSNADGYGDCAQTCYDAFFPKTPFDYALQSIFGYDPNDKYGSTGVVNSPYINSISPLNYAVHFENVDTATASVQKALIIDSLNKTSFDLSTFQLTRIGFGDTTITIPAGKKSFTADIDLRPQTPLIARVLAYLNDSTGVVSASLISLDPLTMLPTDSVLLGVLPPNDSTGRGEGFISYSIKAKTGIATGTVINNKADIYFDENAPIATKVWTNIIDNLTPQSLVNTLPLITTSDSIIVNWSGFDNGPAGVYTYNVYYNINGGQWRLWKYNTSLTSDTLIGVMDSTYGFYSIAIDSALNIEDKLPIAEAITTISQVVPLNLLSFNAKKDGKHNLLSWSTSQEINTDRFEIQRTITGREYNKIGVVKAGSTYYTFTDNNPANAINYYRLRLIDKDANFSYSPVRSVNNSNQNLIVYPNPVVDKNLTLNYTYALSGKYSVELYSTEGRLVFSKKVSINNGSLNQVIKLPTVMARGSYMVKVLSANETKVLQQLVVVE